ncbi:MAG: hypothetical protein FWG71_04995 [Synergistaceae bacterium]|nr:hypothetical protein [Synergistaceae bacterium]
MIRVRSAFLVILIAILMAFGVGVQAGYFAARSATLVEGMEQWLEGVKTTVEEVRSTVSTSSGR